MCPSIKSRAGEPMNKKIIEAAKNAFSETLHSVHLTQNDENFFKQIHEAAHLMNKTSNRIITTGMGKSGLIAQKTSATLTSTGTPSVFMHPADALHGDIGNIQNNETVLAYSNSGETRELIELLPHIKLLGGRLIAVTGKEGSTLDQESDISIIYQVNKEGCPLDLAPMASTTITLMIGDALSAALMTLKGFKKEDFGRFHPSGSLGKKLLTKVKDVYKNDPKAIIEKKSTLKEIIKAMVTSNLGAVLIRGSKGHLRGIITDGDLKRALDDEKQDFVFSVKAEEIMTANPAFIYQDSMIEEALKIMHDKKTYVLPVVDKTKKILGLIRMHDIIEFNN